MKFQIKKNNYAVIEPVSDTKERKNQVSVVLRIYQTFELIMTKSSDSEKNLGGQYENSAIMESSHQPQTMNASER